jgi:GDPmannose 4,6-dehydratase
MAFAQIGVTLRFEGTGVDEKGFVETSTHKDFAIKIGQEVVSVDTNYFRPTEVDLLVGDASKAKEKLGWVPEYSLKDLVKEMMGSDLKLMQKEQYLKEGGYTTLNYFE